MDSSRRGRRVYEEYGTDEVVDESVGRRKKRRESSGTEIAHYCGRESVRLFGVVFPKHSYPIDASSFRQIDSTRWCLDMTIFVGMPYDDIKEMCIFLINQYSLPPNKALAVYVQSPGSQFQYCGAVSAACPSTMVSLLWPKPGGQMQLTATDVPLCATIGIAAEDLSGLPALNIGQYYHIEQLALRVGENLFNFMQSFSKVQDDRLVVPLNMLDQWFIRFREKARRDPEYLKQFIGTL